MELAGCEFHYSVMRGRPLHLPLVSREWKNGSNSSYNCTPFLHSLLTKGKFRELSNEANFGCSCNLHSASTAIPMPCSDFRGQ